MEPRFGLPDKLPSIQCGQDPFFPLEPRKATSNLAWIVHLVTAVGQQLDNV
jgi:hypothetical protein